MKTIPVDEIKFHPHSFADPAGRLFWWKGALYRGLRCAAAELFSRLLRDGTLQRLTDRGLLIDTEATGLRFENYQMVVRHRVVPFPSYPEEWCPRMLKDAALTLLDLLIELARDGLTLKDSHPWNLLFDRGSAIYVDVTSITPIGDDVWRGYDEFCRFYRNPLILMAHGQERIARRLLLEYDGVRESEIVPFIGSMRARLSIPAIISRLKKAGPTNRRLMFPSLTQLELGSHSGKANGSASNDSLTAQFQKTRQAINVIDLPSVDGRSNIGDGIRSSTGSWTATQCRVQELFIQLKPQSVLDIGCDDNGWYSRAAAACGNTALAMSTDSLLLAELYQDARLRRWPLLPVVMDFTDPTPSRGLGSHWSIAAEERLNCQMVLALSAVRRYVFQRSLNFGQIVDGLAAFSRRWLVTEFVPADDVSVGKTSTRRFPWYRLENFVSALQSRFKSVTPLSVDTSGRVLLTCEK